MPAAAPHPAPSIGIRLHDAAPGTLGERAQSVLSQGFSCVHLALGKVLGPEFMLPAAATPGLASYVQRELRGLPVAVLGCYLNLAHPDDGEYRQAVRQYVAQLRLVRWLGAGVVGTETGNPNREYAFDPQTSHSDASLELFIRRLAPVIKAAESLGAVLAIEPVYTHIVHDGSSARRVLDAVASPNLQVIFDPINLLHPDNLDRREEVLAEAIELLGDDVAILHLKDYVKDSVGIRSVAAGEGELDYGQIVRYLRGAKPALQITLEDTAPHNAQRAREFTANLFGE